MMTDWTIRDQVQSITQNWPFIVGVILLGCVIGWVLSYILPANYQTETALNVAINADVISRNPDDFKNWQMEQLDAFVLSDEVLQEVLSDLRPLDSYWQSISINELKDMLSVRWRSVGEWRLVVQASTQNYATQVAQVLGDVVLQMLLESRTHAAQAIQIEKDLNAIVHSQTANRVRILELEHIQQGLISWKDEVETSKGTEPLTELERWRLQSMVGRVLQFDPISLSLLETMPTPDSPAKTYVPWVEQALVLLTDELDFIQQQIVALQEQYSQLNQQWMDELDAAHGLSARLFVEPIPSEISDAVPLRQPEIYALIGGCVGFLTWLFYRLVRLTKLSR